MRGTGRKAVATTAVIITAGLGLAAVGAPPAGAAAQPTGATKQYCAEVKQIADDFGDPGIDAIFEGNPEPSLADWAAFLPGPIARMQAFADDLEATDPPGALAPDVRTVVKRWAAVIAYYEAVQDAAAAGDQKAFDALGGSGRRDPLVKKLGKAMNKVGKACGIAGDGES
jgi:hypothetical protein